MLETPNLKVIYEDDTGELLLHVVERVEGPPDLVLHAVVHPDTSRSLLLHYRNVMISVLDSLSQRGFSKLKTWVQEDKDYRYAMFFGFVPTGNEVQIDGYYGPPIYELEVDL